jgi:hypothetical protein
LFLVLGSTFSLSSACAPDKPRRLKIDSEGAMDHATGRAMRGGKLSATLQIDAG